MIEGNRAHLLDLVARENMLLAGARLNAPAFGRRTRENRRYRFVPAM